MTTRKAIVWVDLTACASARLLFSVWLVPLVDSLQEDRLIWRQGKVSLSTCLKQRESSWLPAAQNGTLAFFLTAPRFWWG